MPPENSTPSGTPCVQITTSPTAMSAHDAKSAGQRYLTKVKLGSVEDLHG